MTIYRALGLMSGTSMDGIDCALIETDGYSAITALPAKKLYPYTDAMREALRSVQGEGADRSRVGEIGRQLTDVHAEAVLEFCRDFSINPKSLDVVGFHGQTIYHNPGRRLTWQIGDGRRLAHAIGAPVVDAFRVMDVAAGGQGAPLVPLYHLAKAAGLEKPLAILNIGGVANVTYIGADNELLAFDTGPGNALLDDWLRRHTGKAYDEGGQLAKAGRCFYNIIEDVLDWPFFDHKPPKSLDRHDFHSIDTRNLSPADGAATLTALTARTIAASAKHFPEAPKRWLICGGGRHNETLMQLLSETLEAPVEPVESVGWDGDFLEAEAFAYLAVRSLLQLPLTLPGTTGVPMPLSGGVLHRP